MKRNRSLTRLLAAFGVILAGVLLLTLQVPSQSAGVRTHGGDWQLTEVASGEQGTFAVPGLLRTQGYDSGGHFMLQTTIDIPQHDEPWALWVERPVYAAIVRIDSAEVGRSGDPMGTERSDRDIVALLAVPPGTHTLQVELHGDFGKGGILGGVHTGPLRQIMRQHNYNETANAGFGMGAAMMALLHLSVVFLRPRRLPHLTLGLFAMSISAYAFCHADMTYGVLTDALWRLRVLRVSEAGLGAFGGTFIVMYTQGRIRTFDRWLIGLFISSAVIGVLAPPSWLYSLESVQDLGLLVVFAGLARPAAIAFRDRIPGSDVLAVALALMFMGAVNEMLVTHGLIQGASWLWASMLLFVTGLSIALMVQDAAARARHERLVDESADAMVLVNPAGRVVQANPVTAKVLGDVNAGDDLLRHIAPIDRAVARSHLQIGQLRPHRGEFRVGEADGQQVVESVATPLDAAHTLLVLRDVTRRRLAEQGLLDAARMETAGLLAGGLAHDLNNMLAALLGNVDLLAMKLGPEHQQRLERMATSVERASMLTRRLLTYSGPTTGSLALAPVDMEGVLADVESLVMPMLGRNVRFTSSVASDLPHVLGSEADLVQIFVNLIVNARDALANDGGHIELFAQRFAIAGGATGVIVLVEDDGPGVPERLQEQIWRPFMTTKPSHKGTGLGLAVADQIIRHHGGRIWHEARPQGGAQFLVALCEASTAPASAVDGTGTTVLLVEDEESLQASYAEGLSSQGFAVVPFPSADEARIWLADNEPDVLVTDVVMPGISGLELAQICDQQYPRVPILLVSGFIPDEAIDGMSTASWHRLEKPVRADRLAITVNSLVGASDATALTPNLDQLTSADAHP